jgi:hypothetical protein
MTLVRTAGDAYVQREIEKLVKGARTMKQQHCPTCACENVIVAHGAIIAILLVVGGGVLGSIVTHFVVRRAESPPSAVTPPPPPPCIESGILLRPGVPFACENGAKVSVWESPNGSGEHMLVCMCGAPSD